MAKSTPKTPKINLTESVGVSGYKQASGYVWDEFLPELRGVRGRRKYREMADSDPIIGGLIYAITSIVRAANWNIVPAETDTTGEYADWLDHTVKNMPEITWDQTIEEALKMLVFGFALLEIVIMKKPDGSVGLRKLAPRGAETIEDWITDRAGNVFGANQTPPMGGAKIPLPLEKLIHFKTCYANGNPEGRSILRNAYKSYHYIQTVMQCEAIGAERDLTGLPVMYAPAEYLETPANRSAMEKIVRDVKFNSQGGLVIPSNPYDGPNGEKTATRMFELKLISAEGGASKVDTRKIIVGHQTDMARSVLADFIMLGNDGKGSYSLSKDKSGMFLRAIEGLLENVGQTLDRQLVPLLWRLNGFPEDMKPTFQAGRVSPVDLVELGDFVAKISGAGVALNDYETEEYLRGSSGLPPPPPESEMLRMSPEEDHEDKEQEDEEENAGN